MAELTKKLHFRKNGTEQTAKAYSTIDEAGSSYVPLKIDGVACYAPLGATDNAMATNSRVKQFKYYNKVEWTQPALTSENSYGTLTSDCPNSDAHISWKAFDGDEATWWETKSSITSAYLNWNIPDTIYVTGVTIKVRTGDRPNLTVRVYTDSTKTVPIGDSLTFNTAGQTQNVLNIPVDGVGTNNLYFDCSSPEDYLGICEIKISAYKYVESTVSDYDKIESDIKAIKSQSKPPYAEVSYTTAGTHTFTVPAGVTRLRVAVCGGGTGGVLMLPGSAGYSGTVKATNGGNSSFGGLVTATGATGGSVGWTEYGMEDNFIYITNSKAGSPNGNVGSSGEGFTLSKSGGQGFALSFTKSSGGYGSGGSCVVTRHVGNSRFVTGSSGGYNSQYITVTSGTSYSVTVGGGGAGAIDSSRSGWTANAGNSGFVLIAYGGDI